MHVSQSFPCASPTGLTSLPVHGEVIAGKYRLVRLLGSGGMGLVFEALHLRLRQSVAIKFLRPGMLAVPEATERFEREARANARLRGPHVVHVLDVDVDGKGRPYMVMELLRGRDLDAELQARGRSLPISLAVDWLLQACAAIDEAHAQGVVHRDLKPSNLFLIEDRGAQIVKVLDFGISKVTQESEPSVTSATSTVGTPLYMSPEQVRSSKDLDLRTDIWSLGVILYELVAGNPPFFGATTAAIAAIVADATPSIRVVRPDVPEGLERAIMAALAKAPGDRFPTAEAFGASLIPFASAGGLTGPFSLRPSPTAFAMASKALARTEPSPRRSAPPLLGVPTWRVSDNDPGLMGDALRTFAGSLAIGIGIATSVTLASPPPAFPSSPISTTAPALTSRPSPLTTVATRPRAAGSVPGSVLHHEPTSGPREPPPLQPAPDAPAARRPDRHRYL